jgi:GNAT superfamily N-acetyltransferase
LQADSREAAAARRRGAATGILIELISPRSERDWSAARRLIEEYAASLGVDLCFQNIDHELEHLAQEYGPPAGAFLLAVEEAGRYVGCVGLRRFAEGIGEMKRLYTIPATRGRGTGRLLAKAIVAEAEGLGYRRLVLDTLPSMQEAQALYASLGFVPTAAYRFNPIAGTAYLELTLPVSR